MSAKETSNQATACPSCGALPASGFTDCQGMWDHLLAESFSNFAYARFHRAIVDAYSLQHPDEYCKSAKSYAAHLTGMCVAVEHAGDDTINAAMQRWLSGNPQIDKPPVPAERGRLTLASVIDVESPKGIAAALEAWFAEVWRVYAQQHEVTYRWIRALG